MPSCAIEECFLLAPTPIYQAVQYGAHCISVYNNGSRKMFHCHKSQVVWYPSKRLQTFKLSVLVMTIPMSNMLHKDFNAIFDHRV